MFINAPFYPGRTLQHGMVPLSEITLRQSRHNKHNKPTTMTVSRDLDYTIINDVIPCGCCKKAFPIRSNEIVGNCGGCNRFFHCGIAGWRFTESIHCTGVPRFSVATLYRGKFVLPYLTDTKPRGGPTLPL